MKKVLLMVSAAATLLACTPEHQDEKQEISPAAENTHHHSAPENDIGIALNQGQKWKVNSEMMTHVQNMESDIQSFQGVSLEEYKALAEKIKNHIGELTSSCTMTGPSHEELHKWLHPFIELSEEFENSDSVTSAQQHYEEIRKQMEVFHHYFE